jgi:hypothetical protein
MSKTFEKRVCLAVVVAAAAAAAGVPLHAAVPAFPGAMGPGAIATGGRGGDVYHVTNLNPDKAGTVPGSLQYGINNAPGAGRTIVFDVGGTIYLNGLSANDTLRYGKSNVTIAGQTAPGPGITIAGTATKWTGSNVILRNISIDPNINSAGVTFDAFSLQVKNSILDHVSAHWYTDEGISITDAGETSTVQFANISEGLNSAGHSYGSIISTEVDGTQYAYVDNLYAHNASRMPRIGSEPDRAPIGATVEFSNNVIYNWANSKAGYSGTDQPSRTNFVNNYYIKGSNVSTNIFSGGDLETGATYFTDLYQSGNKFDTNKNGVFDGPTVGSSAFTGEWRAAAKATVAGIGTLDSADVALQRVLDYGGANWQNRSATDARIVNSVRTGTGSVINTLTGTPLNEWNALMSQTTGVVRAANYDTDGDGMPDTWEAAHGLSPTSAAGANGNNGSAMNDGYTNLEAYINELGAFPASGPLVFGNANGNGRFAEIGNWGNVFKPSRFDTVQVNAGTATVDVVGQHARTLSVATNSGNTAALAITGGWLDVVQTLSVGPGGAGTVNHSNGIVRAGTSVVIGGTNQAGTYNLSGGTLATPLLTKGAKGGTFNFTGGTLHAGTVNFGLVNNAGTLSPGSDAALQAIAAASMPDASGVAETVPSLVGTTHVVGSLQLTAGTLAIDLASPGSFDSLAVDGTLTLGGNLAVTLLDGYTPAPGTQWLIGTAGSIGGAFESISPNFTTQISGGNLYLLAVPEPSSVALLALAGVTGLALRRRRQHRRI